MPPHSWVQEIVVGEGAISVREEIVRSDRSVTRSSLQARFDGCEHPVEGSPAVDTISYQRADRHTIIGTGRKQGEVTLIETVKVDPAGGCLTMYYQLHRDGEVVASGVARFDRESRQREGE
jgi:hypothetical protein